MDERTEIVDVWANNLEEEFERIRDVVEKHPYVAIDTEFPGIVARPTGNVLDYNYQTIKCNVDLLKVIQLGVTFSNGKGELPKVSTWQFNFKFDLDCDMYAQNSIDFLKLSGINFEKHQSLGIELLHFGEVIMSSGLIMNEDVKWISFHGCYDFAYLLKILTCSALPQNEAAFFDLLNDFFPSLYDIKYLLLNLNIKQLSRTFSLQKISEILCVKRIGRQHQAGSDSLVTCKTFFKLMELYFDNKIDDKKYSGVIYGLGSTIKNYTHNRSEDGSGKYSGNTVHYSKNNMYAPKNSLGMKNENLIKGENKMIMKNGKHGSMGNIGSNICGNSYGVVGGGHKDVCNKESSPNFAYEGGGSFSNVKKMESAFNKGDNNSSGSILDYNNCSSVEKNEGEYSYMNNYSVDRNDGNWNYTKETRTHIKNELMQNYFDGNPNNFNHITNYANAQSSISANLSTVPSNMYSNNLGNNNGNINMNNTGNNSNSRGNCNSMNKFGGSKYGQLNGSSGNKGGRVPLSNTITNTGISNRDTDGNGGFNHSANFNNMNYNNVNFNSNSGFNTSSNFNSNANFNSYNNYGNYNYNGSANNNNNNSNNNSNNNNNNNTTNDANNGTVHNNGYNGNGMMYSSNNKGNMDGGNSKMTGSIFNDMAKNVSNNINDMNNMNGMNNFQNMNLGEYNNFANMSNFNSMNNNISLENVNNINNMGSVNNMSGGYSIGNMSNHMNGMNVNVNQMNIGNMNNMNNFSNIGDVNKNAFQPNSNTMGSDGMMNNNVFCTNMNFNNYSNSHTFLNNMNYNSYSMSVNSVNPVNQMNNYNNLTNMNGGNISNTNGVNGMNNMNGMNFNCTYGSGNKINSSFNSFSNNQVNYSNVISNINSVAMVKKSEMEEGGDITEKNGKQDNANMGSNVTNMHNMNKNGLGSINSMGKADMSNNLSNNSNNKNNMNMVILNNNGVKNKISTSKVNSKHMNFKGNNIIAGTGTYNKNVYKGGVGGSAGGPVVELADGNMLTMNTRNKSGKTGNGSNSFSRVNSNVYEHNITESYSSNEMEKHVHIMKTGINDFNRTSGNGNGIGTGIGSGSGTSNFINEGFKNDENDDGNNGGDDTHVDNDDGVNIPMSANGSKGEGIIDSNICNISGRTDRENKKGPELLKREQFRKGCIGSLNNLAQIAGSEKKTLSSNETSMTSANTGTPNSHFNNNKKNDNNINNNDDDDDDNDDDTNNNNNNSNNNNDNNNNNSGNNNNNSTNNNNNDNNNNSNSSNNNNNSNDSKNSNDNNTSNGSNNNSNNNDSNGNNSNDNNSKNNNSTDNLMIGNGNSRSDPSFGVINFASHKNVVHGLPFSNNKMNNINTDSRDNNNTGDKNVNENNNGNNGNKYIINSTNDTGNSDNENDESNNNINSNNVNSNNIGSTNPTPTYTATTTNNNNNNNIDKSSNRDGSCNTMNLKNNNNNISNNSNSEGNNSSSCDGNRDNYDICNGNNNKNKSTGNSTNGNYSNKSGINRISNVPWETNVTNNRCYATMDRNSTEEINNYNNIDDNNNNNNNNTRNGTSVLFRCGKHVNNYNMGISEEGHHEAYTTKDAVIPVHRNKEKNGVESERNESSNIFETHGKNISRNYNSGYNVRNTRKGNIGNSSNQIKMGGKNGHENGSNMYSSISSNVEEGLQTTNANLQIHNKTAKNEKMHVTGSRLNCANSTPDINNKYNESSGKLSLHNSVNDVTSFKPGGKNNVPLGVQRFVPLEELGNESHFVNCDSINCNNIIEGNQENTVLDYQHNRKNIMKDMRNEDMDSGSNELNMFNRFGKSATENVNFSKNCNRNNYNVSKPHGVISVNNMARGCFKNNNMNTGGTDDTQDSNTYNEDNRKHNTTVGNLHGTNQFHKSSTSSIITNSSSNFSRGSIPYVNNYLNNYSTFPNSMNIDVGNNICHKI